MVLRSSIEMLTKTVRSRFNHEIGEKVEGCTIVERRVVIPPDPDSRRLGVYDYVVEVPPASEAAPRKREKRAHSAAPSTGATEPGPDDFTRSTPEERAGLIRRLPRMIVVQAANNSPIVSAIKLGLKQVVPFSNFHTVAEAITTGNPMGGDEIIAKAAQYGWLAGGAGVTAWTALVEGVVADYARTADSRNANIFLIVCFVLILGTAYWLIDALLKKRDLDNCVGQGRRN